MNKKIIFYTAGLILGICVFLYFVYSDPKKADEVNTESQIPQCLVFQSQYPERDCFREEVQVATSSLGVPNLQPSYPCKADNAIEAEDCVIQEAKETKIIDKCALLSGVSKEKCLGINLKEVPLDTRIINSQKTIPVISPIATTTPFKEPQFQNSIFTQTTNRINTDPDPRFTLEGLISRFKESYPVRLYGFSEYQVAPGTEIDAYGMNFTHTDNTLVIGSARVSGIPSADSLSIHFTVPALSTGTYDAYVENANGNSQGNQKVSIVITPFPLPRPIITSASPSPALPTDTVTLSGENLLSGSNVVTTLGVLSSVPASGTSLSFNIGDLEKTKELVVSGQLKGQIFPLLIYVQNGNGLNKDYFTLNVQF